MREEHLKPASEMMPAFFMIPVTAKARLHRKGG